MAMDFKVGGVVVLKSGGPSMTVHSCDGDSIFCVWFEKKTQKSGHFPPGTLEKDDSPGGGTLVRG